MARHREAPVTPGDETTGPVVARGTGQAIERNLRDLDSTADRRVQRPHPRRHGPFPDADLRRFAGEPHAFLLSCAGKIVTVERVTDEEVRRDLMQAAS